MRKKAKREYEKKLLKRFKDKPKLFYSYVRNKQKVKPEIPQLNTGDGIMTSSDEEIAQEFGNFFGSVFTRETDNENNYPEFESRMHGNNILQNVRITENDVCEKLKRLKEDKACGPDGIHPKLLKECAEIIAIPLYLIFSKSLESGVVPADWKLANVSPIHKKGSRAMASNYRPVSLTCLASKLMESIIRDAMVRHLLENDLCTTAQHGFTNGRSCLTNLLETFESWTEDVDKGYSVDVIFLDFQKAFDKVPKKRLLQKLSAYGIEGKVLCWIEDFLSDRRMRIMVRGEYSEWVDVISGVPQGSVLGPILFLIYVNDIPEMVNCSIKMFADDTKLFRTVKSIDDCNILQNDLDTLSQWTNEWLLSFNIDKCKVMHIGKNNPKLEYTMITENENKILIETREEKDLGVWITNDLKPEKQVIAASQRAMTVLRSVKRAFVRFDIETFSIIYTTYIRPHLEYCIQAWAPYYAKDILLLEKVQRRATKLVWGLKDLSYEERLERLKLFSLEERRLRGDLIQTFKLLTGKENVDYEILFNRSTNHLRGHSFKLSKSQCNKLCRRRFFSQRVIDIWNSLSEFIVSAPSTNTFKKRIDNNWKKIWATYKRLTSSLANAHYL